MSKQDQLLVQIDDAVERADLISAEASLARDQAQLERARTLSKRGVSSDAALEEARGGACGFRIRRSRASRRRST